MLGESGNLDPQPELENSVAELPKQVEDAKPFEPEIDDDYLNSYLDIAETVGPDIEEVLKERENYSEEPLVLEPEPLKGSGLSLRVFKCTKETDIEEGNLRFAIDLIGSEVARTQVKDKNTDRDPRIDLRLEEKERVILVHGAVDNPVSRRLEQGLPASTNLSGVIAPYEDLFCQMTAELNQKPVTRTIVTHQPEKSRFVQNYVNRGYEIYRGKPATPEANPSISLTKSFGVEFLKR